MGQSTTAYIAFGIPLGYEEDIEVPWEDGDFKEWYRTINGYKNPFDPFGEDGNWLPELDTEDKQNVQYEKYSEYRTKFDNDNPCPLELNYQGYREYPTYVLTLSKYTFAANKPEEFYPKTLRASEGFFELMDFVRKHFPNVKAKAGWYFFSNWG